MHIEVINHALADLPPERLRLHLCWGNYEGPHHHDVPLRDIMDLVLQGASRGDLVRRRESAPRARVEGVAARSSCRTTRCWCRALSTRPPTSSSTRSSSRSGSRNYAEVVGRERVIAGTDCGFGTSAWGRKVDARIAWAKLEAMVEGARLASAALW